ncbi:LysM peptidoglycan-binding domain-containing protein [Leuconostoc palmae]|uniref:LysM peptidoglycan-binding domain-containing protein n=1 Tax=Leuconostoc palmae TaxID=501487 RepID=UPI001C7D671B|nr:LysM peptidoglycan-binding domain-containing protein [Leuconostoc palmae]
MFSFTKSITIAAGVAGAMAFGASNASADTNTQNLPTDYVVKSGDTLNKLSVEFNTSVEKIAANNNISDVNLIVVGQHLSLADKVAQDTPSVAAQAPVAATQVQAQAPVQQYTAAPVQQTVSPQVSSSSALDALIARESGGNTSATNGQYYGIGQLSPEARAMYGGNSSDYNDQLNAMKSYISARYGTAENAWAHSQATGWY